MTIDQLKPALLDLKTLEDSSVVANSLMNRERQCTGGNSYAKELNLDPLAWLTARLARQEHVAWLDLCCGRGLALCEAAHYFQTQNLAARITITGIDLVPLFAECVKSFSHLTVTAASLSVWQPSYKFDLITCVHGWHYIGDKLGLLERAAGWLTSDGLLLGHLDLDNIRGEAGAPLGRLASRVLRHHGFAYETRRRLLSRRGNGPVTLPFRYLGANDQAGPNYTGQPAVNSFYCYEK